MTSTVLQLLEECGSELSLSTIATVYGSQYNDNARKLRRHLTAVLRRDLATSDWQELRREHTFTTTATQAQTSGLPSDFLRFVPDSIWNRTTTFRVCDAMSPGEWQADQANTVARIQDTYYVRGGTFYMAPTPAAGETIAYEYVTKNIGTDSGGTALSAFTADTDIPYFDDELLIAGVVWRYLAGEGQDYGEAFREFERLKANRWKENGGSRILDMGGGSTDRKPTKLRIPETISF